MTRASDAILVEKVNFGGGGTIRVFVSNSGRYIAEFKLGTVKWQTPVSGATPGEAMKNAKAWLTTPIGARK